MQPNRRAVLKGLGATVVALVTWGHHKPGHTQGKPTTTTTTVPPTTTTTLGTTTTTLAMAGYRDTYEEAYA